MPLPDDERGLFVEAINSTDMIMAFDWGIKNMIYEEMNAYYRDNVPIENVANALYSRLSVYVSENY